jgi:hypothetical protein
MKTLKIVKYDGSALLFSEVVEYVSGYRYFFVRHKCGGTLSLARARIERVTRIFPDGIEIPVRLVKPKYKTDSASISEDKD